MSFVHLHTHSHYSLLDGLSKINDLIFEASRLEMPALALTDHGNMYGAIEFYKKAKKAGIKPIIGVEAYLAARALKDKEPGIDERRYHLTLLAENDEGYHNLIKLVTISNLEGFYYKPRIDKEVLKQHSTGLIALSGCMGGEIPRTVYRGDMEEATRLVSEYKEIFGKDNFFIETAHHPGIPNHDQIQASLRELARGTKTPIVATQDSHYIKPDDAPAQDVLLAIQTNSKLDDEDRLTMKSDDYSLRSPKIMKELFKDLPEAIQNTLVIAERANLEIPLGILKFPDFPVPNGFTPETFLEKLCRENLPKYYGQHPSDEIKKRLEYELSIIKKTGFSTYMLMVADIVRYATSQKIPLNARGSAGGSLVSFILGIVNTDPIKYNLFFERFLNPDRISPPDIDLDIADTGRDRVLEYVQNKYGRDRVAQIITFGTMAARAAIRDTGRALGMSYTFCDQISKLIPFNTDLKESLETVPDLKEMYETNSEAKRLLDAAKHLEGVARHASVHACGTVISEKPMTEYLTLQYAPQDKEGIITQFEMHSVEDLGLLKMDLLGLKNLTIIEDTVRLVRDIRGEEIKISSLP